MDGKLFDGEGESKADAAEQLDLVAEVERLMALKTMAVKLPDTIEEFELEYTDSADVIPEALTGFVHVPPLSGA
jgi:hypothetical protein